MKANIKKIISVLIKIVQLLNFLNNATKKKNEQENETPIS